MRDDRGHQRAEKQKPKGGYQKGRVISHEFDEGLARFVEIGQGFSQSLFLLVQQFLFAFLDSQLGLEPGECRLVFPPSSFSIRGPSSPPEGIPKLGKETTLAAIGKTRGEPLLLDRSNDISAEESNGLGNRFGLRLELINLHCYFCSSNISIQRRQANVLLCRTCACSSWPTTPLVMPLVTFWSDQSSCLRKNGNAKQQNNCWRHSEPTIAVAR